MPTSKVALFPAPVAVVQKARTTPPGPALLEQSHLRLIYGSIVLGHPLFPGNREELRRLQERAQEIKLDTKDLLSMKSLNSQPKTGTAVKRFDWHCQVEIRCQKRIASRLLIQRSVASSTCP